MVAKLYRWRSVIPWTLSGVFWAYKSENKVPRSRAIEYKSLLALVIQPLVPFTKQIASITVNTTAATRLPVAWYINSVIGILVELDRTVAISPIQKRITRMNAVPLCHISLV